MLTTKKCRPCGSVGRQVVLALQQEREGDQQRLIELYRARDGEQQQLVSAVAAEQQVVASASTDMCAYRHCTAVCTDIRCGIVSRHHRKGLAETFKNRQVYTCTRHTVGDAEPRAAAASPLQFAAERQGGVWRWVLGVAYTLVYTFTYGGMGYHSH